MRKTAVSCGCRAGSPTGSLFSRRALISLTNAIIRTVLKTRSSCAGTILLSPLTGASKNHLYRLEMPPRHYCRTFLTCQFMETYKVVASSERQYPHRDIVQAPSRRPESSFIGEY